MDKYAKAFIKASLIYLGIGAILGVFILLWPDLRFTVTRVHVHILLLGFMGMMIYGVGYHILPVLWEGPVYSHRLGNIQVWLANITLIGLSLSWYWKFPREESGTMLRSYLGLVRLYLSFSLSLICGRV